jgi:hypothetical protein
MRKKTLVIPLAVLIFSFTVLVLAPNTAFGFEIKRVDRIDFMDNSNLEIIPYGISKTEDDLYLIPNFEDGYVYIFKKSEGILKFLKKFGPKGDDSEGFETPRSCFYNQNSGKFGVVNVGAGVNKTIHIFKRQSGNNFKVANIIYADSYDAVLTEDGKTLIVSGYMKNDKNESFDLYTVDLDNPNKKKFLLPSYKKYSLADEQEYQIKYFEEFTIPSIAIDAFVDVRDRFVFFVWSGKLNILKIDLKTGELTSFGEPTNHYVRPSVSKKLLQSFKDKDYTNVRLERNKISLVKDIFTTLQHTFIVYKGANNSISNYRLQMYNAGGILLDEKAIPGAPYQIMSFDKATYQLYCFSSESKYDKAQISVYDVVVDEN